MRKRLNVKLTFFLIIAITLILAVFVFVPKAEKSALAADGNTTEKTLGEAADETLDNMDLSLYDELLKRLEDNNNTSLTASVRMLIDDILKGKNEIDFSYFMRLLGKSVLGEFTAILPAMGAIIVIALLFGVLQNLSSGFSKASTKKLVYVICYGSVLTVLGLLVASSINQTMKTIALLNSFLDVSLPILLLLVSALGGTASVAVYQPMVLIFSVGIFKIVNFVVVPLFYACFIFGILGNLSDELRLDKFAKTAKSAAEWVLGITFSLFIAFVTAQGITGAGIDNLAAKGAKFALASYVPVVGTHLKDGFDIVVASCLVVKNALGLSSVIILIFASLMPIIKLATFILTLRVTAAVIEPVTDKKLVGVLSDTASALMLLVAVLVCIAFSIFTLLMLIIYTCNLGVL